MLVENATGVVFEGCRWHSIEGNGVMLSQRVRGSKVTRCELAGCGDTPIALLGSADLMDGETEKACRAARLFVVLTTPHLWGGWTPLFV